MRVLAIVTALLLTGCVSTQAKVWQRSWNDIRGPYLEYVQKDEKLTQTEKDIRVQHVALLDLTLKDITGE